MNTEEQLLAAIKRQQGKLLGNLIFSLLRDIFFILTVITMVKVWFL